MKFIKICSKCGSTNITSSTRRYMLQQEIFKDNCKDCGYEGFIPEVEESDIENFRKKLKEIK